MQHAPQGLRQRRLDRQAQLLRRHRLGHQGDNAAKYLAKGRPVTIDGRLEWREWEIDGGTKRQAIEIIADSIQFLGSQPSNGSSEAAS